MSFLIDPYRFGPGLHPEVSNWLARVTSNGGSASTATVQALETFCVAIDAQAGLRPAITRLNLFCGDQLAAALVPLYLAESAGAAAKGNATDVNSGSTPFSSANYAATGSSGGITANGSSCLNTGLVNTQFATTTSGHLSCSITGITGSSQVALGSTKDSAESTVDDLVFNVDIGSGNIRDLPRRGSFSLNTVNTAPNASYIHFIGTQTSATSRTLYSNGVAIASNGANYGLTLNSTHPYYVFATNTNNLTGAGTLSTARLRMYSIGSGITAAQAAAFSAAVAAFNTALGR